VQVDALGFGRRLADKAQHSTNISPDKAEELIPNTRRAEEQIRAAENLSTQNAMSAGMDTPISPAKKKNTNSLISLKAVRT
jgi:hypothetical protein